MLLHLGGQDTITAFSMEDCALWKRHLLNLTTQVALAIYVVGKQWQGDKQLVAPMVLIFISGTAKYMERIWILGRAGSWGPISRPWGPLCGQKRTLGVRLDTHAPIWSLFSSDMEDVAHDMFYNSMNYFMNRTSKRLRGTGLGQEERDRLKSDEGVNLAYKLAETQLSLIYDFLYTKFGSLDVAFEISSILMWLMTSYSPSNVCTGPSGGHSPRIVLSILKRLRPAPKSNRLEWSGKLWQYNFIDEIIQKEKATREYGWLKRMMWRIGIKQYHHTTKHVAISPEVKKVFLDKLCDNHWKLYFSSFTAEWAAYIPSSSSGFGAAKQKVRGIFKDRDFVSSAFLWHLVTDICLVRDETPSELRTCSQHVSNYIMHLVYKCNLMVDADGCLFFEECIKWIGAFCKDANYDKRDLLQRFYGDDSHSEGSVGHLASLATDVAFLLNGEVAAADRWEMIATVWMEMLCYIAVNCDHGFHAKQLSAGGEFLTHAKMIMFPILQLADPDEQ
ncbi:unnamed protein product [Triticum turgidum subsp. durum]|uniref:DUF4220 domain-containing protein n=1 Tax=Triticum turgidum subsp. durum TaxID=4567 RepID=A0A9R0PM29_TRITD|nr:unnamed protein product [Triticum turgidum subsp. durum]